jgi:predicted Zn finger-like uncharacterized protein
MPLPVVCPSCKARFQVSEQYAGKQGPCPKCKTTITIPKLEEQVVIHAPEEFAGGATTVAKDKKGRSVLKPIQRVKVPLKWLTVALWGGTFIGLLVAAAVIGRSMITPDNSFVWLTIGAILAAAWVVYPAYVVFRDRELEGFTGLELIGRLALVALIYVSMWGFLHLLKVYLIGADLELFQLLIFLPAPFLIAGISSMAILDLEIPQGVMHFLLFVVLCMILRMLANVDPMVPFMAVSS